MHNDRKMVENVCNIENDIVDQADSCGKDGSKRLSGIANNSNIAHHTYSLEEAIEEASMYHNLK